MMPWSNPDIHVAFQWAGTHSWPDAEGDHEYLKHEHRHLFEGDATIEVTHLDRELEFFAVLDFLNETTARWQGRMGSFSCESMARTIAEELLSKYGNNRSVTVSVLEDGECGASVHWRPEGVLGLLP